MAWAYFASHGGAILGRMALPQKRRALSCLLQERHACIHHEEPQCAGLFETHHNLTRPMPRNIDALQSLTTHKAFSDNNLCDTRKNAVGQRITMLHMAVFHTFAMLQRMQRLEATWHDQQPCPRRHG